MNKTPASAADGKNRTSIALPVVLVFQGGGALGAYQAGVYEALHEAGVEPDWVIGTSIGAINAALVAGNDPHRRIDSLRGFWTRIEQSVWDNPLLSTNIAGRVLSNWATLACGVPGFFRPNPFAFLGPHTRLAPDAAGYYSTRPLEKTLRTLIDFERVAKISPRLTLGAAKVRTSEMQYFDSRDTKITARHVMASGALPPAFPPVRIDGDLFWDGGTLSNTPIERVFDDNPRRSAIIIAVHIWNPDGPEPGSMWDVMHRQKDIQYSSRAFSHIKRQQQIHRLRHVISELARHIPKSQRETAVVQELAAYGCLTQMHVIRLLAPRFDNEDHTKDIDFSRSGIQARWKAGYADMRAVLEEAPWDNDVDPLEGLHVFERRSSDAWTD